MKAKVALFAMLFFVFGACQAAEETTKEEPKETTPKTTEGTKPMTDKKFSEPTKSTIEADKDYQAIIHTSKGDIKVDLYEKEAPLSVTNFKQLAEGGFYNGLTFHRVEPGFVIQGGDPEGTGRGGPGYTIAAEIEGNPHKHEKGALAWARLPDQVNPERRSSGSQFYITLAPTPFLDGGYTVFGKTLEGQDVVEKIAVGDTITSIEVSAQ